MSFSWAGYKGIALVMTEQEFLDFCSVYEQKQRVEIHISMEEIGEIPFTAGNGSGEVFYLSKIGEDCCEGMTLVPFFNRDGSFNELVIDEDGNRVRECQYRLFDGDCYVLFSVKQADDYFKNPSAWYASYEELRQEFQDRLSAYLPETFDWNNHIGTFSYAGFA